MEKHSITEFHKWLLVCQPGVQSCIITPEKERHLIFFSFLALPNSVQGSNICLSVCGSFLCNTEHSHLLRVLEDIYHNYSTEEAVLNFLYDSTPWTAVLFPTESDESVSSPVHFQKSHPYKSLASNPAAVGFFCSGLSSCETNHEDFCLSQVLNYYVHSSSPIPSRDHNSPQVTQRSEYFINILLAVKAGLGHMLYDSSSRLAFPLSDHLTRFAHCPAVLRLIMQPL